MSDSIQRVCYSNENWQTTVKQAAEETRKELEPMKKTLADIDGALIRPVAGPGPRVKNFDTTFGIFRRQDGQLQMGGEIFKISENGTILDVDGVEYDLTPGLHTLIVQKHPRPNQWTSAITKHINIYLYRPRLDLTRIPDVSPDHALHGNISICLGKWLYLGKV